MFFDTKINLEFYLLLVIWFSLNKKRTNERKAGSREESTDVGFFVFSHIRMMGYFRLG